VKVEAVPGPSAPIAALSIAGLHVGSFRFVGFLPRTGGRRRRALSRVASSPEATVLFEAPQRLPSTLRHLEEVAGADRRAAVCRELTKVHEEVVRGTLGELATRFAEAPRGEITLVVEGAPEGGASKPALSASEARARARELRAQGLRTKEIARRLAAELSTTTREAYDLVLRAGDESAEEE